jgi:uncharacterized protein YbjT (DUF2867 family)
MKLIITGSLGNISKPLTKELVQEGHQVTVISSSSDKQKDIEALGAKAAIGSLEDVKFLTAAFTGADAVYTMVPPNDIFNNDLDIMTYYLRIGNNYEQAIRQSGVKRVVHLSSIGAHLDKGTGIILAHHAVEGILNNLSDVSITFMRPTAFYYNLYAFAGGIKAMGMMASNYGADDSIVWVSPIDIADAIAEEITTPFVGRKIRYVASEELTCNEVAGILGAAIGNPDLKWVVISNEQMQNGLETFGMSKQFAIGLVEMNSKMHSGGFFDDYYLNKPAVMGKVKMADFAKDFAAAYLKA